MNSGYAGGMTVLLGADGKPVTEEREIEIPAFRVVTVFDVSQTECSFNFAECFGEVAFGVACSFARTEGLCAFSCF